MKFEDDRIGPGIPERMKQLSEKPLDLDREITRQYIATLQSQLAASQKRERILREGLEYYADGCNWDGGCLSERWKPAQSAIKAAEEVK